MAVVNWSVVSLLLGNGDGTFSAGVSFPINGPTGVAIADVNADGIPDLAVSNFNDASVILGLGNGVFSAPVSYPAGIRPLFLAMGDLNADGIPDIAVANNESHDVSVLIGQGDGTFAAPVSYPAGNGPLCLAIRDLDADGIPDIAVANNESHDVSVLIGRGDGTFAASAYYAAGNGPVSVVIGDLNSDGISDLAVANSHSPDVSVLMGRGDGSFVTAESYHTGIRPLSLTVGDLNGDGIEDLVIPHITLWADGGVHLFLGHGDGRFAQTGSYPMQGPVSTAMGDINGDGIPDLAVANFQGNLSILLGHGDGTFEAGTRIPVGTVTSVAITDLNAYGKSDLVATGIRGTVPATDDGISGVHVFLGHGDGTFALPVSYPADSMSAVAVEDLEGDGIKDLVLTHWSGFVSVYLGNGDGTFAIAVTYAVGNQPQSVTIGDLNGDRIPDLVVPDSRFVTVLLGHGDGTFAVPARNAVEDRALPASAAIGDLNGDGIPDLAVANMAILGGIHVLPGNGDGTFGEPAAYRVGAEPRAVALRDLNGDGALDVITAAGSIKALLNRHPVRPVLAALPLAAYPATASLSSGQARNVTVIGGKGEITAISSDAAIAMTTVTGRTVTVTGGRIGGTVAVRVSDGLSPAHTTTISVAVTAAAPVGDMGGFVTRAVTPDEPLSLLLNLANRAGIPPARVSQEWFVFGFGPISTGMISHIFFITAGGTVVPLEQAAINPGAAAFNFDHSYDTHFIGSLALGPAGVGSGNFVIYGHAFSTTPVTDFGNAPNLAIENIVRIDVQ